MTVPDPAPTNNPLGAKPSKWAHGGDVAKVTLGDGSIAEAMAAIGYAWDATSATFVQATVDHATGGIKVYVAGQAGGGSAVSIADGADVAQGAIADVAYVSGSGTVVAILKGIFSKLAGTLTVDASGHAVPVTDNAGSLTVDGTFFQATQPVSVASGSDVATGAIGDAAWASGNGTVIGLLKNIATKLAGSVAVTGTFWQGTQPVSGTFWQATQPVSGTFWQATQPVSGTVTATQGTAGSPWPVAENTDSIYNGSTALTPKWATITASSSGANSQVALVSNKKIRVIGLALMSNGTVNVKFQSHVTPTDKTGLFYLIANTGFVLPYNPKGWFETVSGEALDINLSGNVAVGGVLQYIEV